MAEAARRIETNEDVEHPKNDAPVRSLWDFLSGGPDRDRPEGEELPGAFSYIRERWGAAGGEGVLAKYRRLSAEYQEAKERQVGNLRVYEQIAQAARLSKEFLALLVASCLIATFGLLADSAATVIGAMIIAPLMMPILGFSLASIWGDPRLLRRSLATLGIGVGLVIGTSAVFVALIPGAEVTSQIAARGNPSLYDVGVAIACGLIGAYAYVNPRISPSIAGVAIAVALVPPLCCVGIGIALLDSGIAGGAMLLFLSNLVGIALAASFVFWRMRVHPATESQDEVSARARRNVALSSVLLLLIAAPLAYFMVQTVRQRRQASAVHDVVAHELAGAQVLSQQVEGEDVRVVLLVPSDTRPASIARAHARVESLVDGEVRLAVLRAERLR